MVVNHWRCHHYDSDERELVYRYFQGVPGTIVIRQWEQIPANFICLHKIMILCYCNPELSVKTAPDSFLAV